MRILYVTTIAGSMVFFPEQFKSLRAEGHTVELACNCDAPLRDDIVAMGMKVHNISFSRVPFSRDNLTAYKELKKLVESEKYDIVHCHTPNAAAVTRLVYKRKRKLGTKIFYTVHGFHFYKGAPVKNWALYYPFEWLCAHWTDVLITINAEDYALAQKKMKAQEVVYIPGVGINLEKFDRVNVDKKTKRLEMGIPENATVLLSVGELNQNKNHETVIRSITGLDVYYVIAGQGREKEHLEEVAAEVDMADRVKLLGYRTDVMELYSVANVFIFPSFREGLSLSLMETMASGLPAVVSRIRGNTDLIDENGGVFFDPSSVRSCREAIEELLAADRLAMGAYNKEKVKKFEDRIVIEQIEALYQRKNRAPIYECKCDCYEE